MNARLKRIANYILDRAAEPSTWRGVTLLLSAIGAYISPEKAELITVVGLFVAGLVGVAFADRLNRAERQEPMYWGSPPEVGRNRSEERSLDNIEIPEEKNDGR